MQAIWAEYDEAIPLTQLRYMEEAFPLRATHRLPARHFLQEEQAEAASAHIAEFVAQLRDCP